MAKRVFTTQGVTFTASAAGSATATAVNTYMDLTGGGATQLIDVLEVLISGMASASALGGFALARESTGSTGGSALAAPQSDSPLFPNATALSSTVVPQTQAATTGPTPSNTPTDAKLNLSLNLFGGILRWNAAPTQQWQIIGNAAPGGKTILWNSSTAGGASGLANAHIIYEPY